MQQQDNAIRSNPQAKLIWTGAIISILVTLSFMLAFSTHFVGVRCGSGTYPAGRLMLMDIIPYRDYFCQIPFLSLMKAALSIKVFGDYYMVMRLIGIAVRLVVSLVTFLWLSRLFRAKDACLGTIVCMVVSCGDYDMIDFPNFDAILLAISAGFASSFVLDKDRTLKQFCWIAFLSGLLTGLTALAKQSVGAGITLCLPLSISLCLVRLDRKERLNSYLPMFAAGWLSVIGSGIAWLCFNGALSQFLFENFVGGPSAKANIFFNHIEFASQWWWAILPAFIAAIVACFPMTRSTKSKSIEKNGLSGLLSILALGLSAVGVGVSFGLQDFDQMFWAIPKVMQIALTYFTRFAAVFFLGVLLFRQKTLSERGSQHLVLTIIAFAIGGTLSLSAASIESMLVPGLAYLIAALLDSGGKFRNSIGYCFAALAIALGTFGKMLIPYTFMGVSEPPVRLAKFESSVPRLKGFYLPEETVKFVDSTVDIVNKYSKPEDTIYIYPDFSLLYALTDRRCPTHSYHHVIDIVSDQLGESEAKLILEKRPAVLIYCQEKALTYLEKCWRHGKPSGLREIQRACEELSREYREIRTVEICGWKYSVFIRPDALER